MGRQIAYMIYAHFQTNPKMDFSYGIEDLGDLKWHGDQSIPTSLYVWIILLRMESSKLLEVDLAHYDRQAEDHPDK
eukprot:13577555-Heterocapsa_arctica.AAC.1